MKSLITRLVLLLIFILPGSFLFSQIPQGLNYQAIARDASGNPITGQTIGVKLSILSDTLGFKATGAGVYIWEEEHLNVKTNAFGLFSVVLGLGTKVGGTAETFDTINWTSGQRFLGTKIAYPSTYRIMGSAKLWSVPYSLYAKDLSGPVNKFSISGVTEDLDEALFEVKNNNGQTVFAVYNEGVRIYVSDGISKGAKGGFAVGGFGTDKSISQPYLVVNADSIRAYIYDNPLGKASKGGFAVGGFDGSKALTNDYLIISPDSSRIYVDNAPSTKGAKGGFAVGGFDASKGAIQKLMTVSDDSVRIYIDETAGKGAKGGFAVGGFDATKGNNKEFLNIHPFDTYILNPSEPRVLWYPIKNAFLTGQVLIHHKDSIGLNSTTTGFESRAKGNWSQAFGYKAIARGLYSTAIGNQAVAHKNNSFAFGESAYAGNIYSYALGKSSRAAGDYAFALGNTAIASGYSSYAFGENVTAANSYSYAFGKGTSTGNSYAVAMGNGSSATGFSSYAFGEVAAASKQYSYAFGKGSKAQGDYSFALGNNATASGANAFALGEGVTASFPNSYAFGLSSSATNTNAIAMGWNASASGTGSFAINGTAQGASSFAVNGTAVGSYSKAFGGTANGSYSMTSGSYATTTGDYSIAMGYRVATNGMYAVAIGAGNYLSPYTTTYAGALGAISIGSQTRANGIKSIAIGSLSVANGENSVAIGTVSTAGGIAAMALGNFLTAGSAWSTAIGYNNYSWGSAIDATNLTDPLFMIGNGFSGTESNAVAVLKNGRVGINMGTSVPTHILDIRGQVRITESAAYDVWIQGGSITGSGYTDNRNLALIGFDEDGGDKLFVNFLGEYAGGTEIGGPVAIPGTLSVTGALNFADPFSRTITTPRQLYVNAAGQVGGISSSIRYKENIRNLDDYFWLYSLRPVYYNYKTSPGDLQFGLIAEEVAEVNPLLIIYGSDGKPDGLMYDKLTVPMLKALQDQKKIIDEQKGKIENLEKELSEIRELLNKNGIK